MLEVSLKGIAKK